MASGTDWSAEVDAVVGLVAEHYVFPEVALLIGRLLRRRLADGAYQPITDEETFARVLTADLQSVNGDQHLRVLHSVEEIPEDNHAGAPLERHREEARLCGHGFARVERLAGNVGLLDIRRFFRPEVSGPAAVAAMSLVADADVLLIDLRRNAGGNPGMVAMICSYLFDRHTHLNDLHFGPDGGTVQFWALPWVPGEKFGGSKPLFVLTSSFTFSAGEELSYNLRQLNRATLVGETTRGGAHPGGRYRVGGHLQATVPSARAVNPLSGTNWETIGVEPHVAVPAGHAFDVAYRSALRHVLALGRTGARRTVAQQAGRALAELPDRPVLPARCADRFGGRELVADD